MNDTGDPHRVLARNAACHQCRRRKLKCDAVRPTCGNCRKPRQRGPEKYEPPEPCTWDQYRDPSARTLRKREAKQRRSISHGPGGEGGSQPPPPLPPTWGVDQGQGQVYSGAPLHGNQADPQYSGAAGAQGYAQVDMSNVAGPSTLPQHMQQPQQPQQQQQHVVGEHMQSGSYNANGPWPSGGSTSSIPSSSHLPDSSVNGGGYAGVQPQSSPSSGSLRQHPPLQQPTPHQPPGAPGLGIGDSGMFFNGSGAMVWSEWPRDLPSEEIVRHIFQVFFDRVCVIPKMMHRPSTMASLALSPNNIGFPAVALIHAVLAVTTSYLAPEAISSRAYFPIGASATDSVHPEYDFVPRSTLQPASLPSFASYAAIGDGTAIHRFQMWHRRKSLEAMSELMMTGQKLVQLAQAMVCITWVDMMNGWWSEMWMESANAVRIAVPLCLHLSSTINNDPLSHNVGDPIGRAMTPLEQAERDRTWWMIYMTDRCSGFGTTWVQAIAHDEITVELPVAQHLFDHAIGNLLGVQTLDSPDLLSNHPPQHKDAFPLLMKTIYLFSNTITFIRRYSRGQHTYSRYLSDPGLRKCLNDINTFRMHCPPSMRRPIQRNESGVETIDPDLFYCLNLTHAAVLNLGGPLITSQTWKDEGANMILHAVRAILSLLYDLQSTSYDISLLPVVNSFAWYLAGRCLIRFSAAARGAGDHMQASIFDAELQTLNSALVGLGQRHPVALRYCKILGMLRDKLDPTAGEIITLKTQPKDLFDSEFSSNAPRRATSSGSDPSPNAFVRDPNSSTPTATASSNPSADKGVTPPMMSGTSNSPAQFAAPPPTSINVSPVGVPAMPNTSQQPPLQHTQSSLQPHQPPPPHQSHQSHQPHQPPPPPQHQHQHQGHVGGVYPMHPVQPGHEWFKTDSFDINSYSFDVEAMSQMLTRTDPNATFDGSMVFPQQTM